MAFHSVLPDRADESWEVTHIICAACKQVIGVLDSSDYLEEHAEAIATAHTMHCQATDEEREQAIYDMKFRKLTEDLGL